MERLEDVIMEGKSVFILHSYIRMRIRLLYVVGCLVSFYSPLSLWCQLQYSDFHYQTNMDLGHVPNANLDMMETYGISYSVEFSHMGKSRSTNNNDPREMAEYHVVQQGQTLYRIGKIYNVSVDQLMALNGINNSIIYPGQKLLLRRRMIAEEYDQASNSSQIQIGGGQSEIRPTQGTVTPQQSYRPSRHSQYSNGPSDKTVYANDYTYAQGETNPMYKNREDGLPNFNEQATQLRAIHIGISKYDDQKIPPLRFARNDAFQMRRMWENQKGKTFGKVDCYTLADRQTRSRDIRQTLQAASQNLTGKDLLVISISGHAIVVGGELRILPSDYQLSHPDQNYLTTKDILQSLGATYANILLILDVCYSGQAGYDVAQMVRDHMKVAILTSSRSDERSSEHNTWQHGAFTRAMLEGAYGYADINQDSWISLTELQFYIQARVRDMTHNTQHANSPINFLGDMVLFKN